MASDSGTTSTLPPLQLEALLESDGGRVQAVCWRRDGQVLAAASDDCQIRLWDLAGRRTAVRLIGHEAAVVSVAFSPDGMSLASAAQDGTVRIWTASTGAMLQCFYGPTAFRGVDWDPSGRQVLALQTKRIHLWQIDLAGPPKILFEHDQWVRRARWVSPDRVVSCGDEGQMILWDTQFLRPVQRVTVDAAGLTDIALVNSGVQTDIW